MRMVRSSHSGRLSPTSHVNSSSAGTAVIDSAASYGTSPHVVPT